MVILSDPIMSPELLLPQTVSTLGPSFLVQEEVIPGLQHRVAALPSDIRELQKLPQVEMPVTHRFQPGVYLREIFMPAGTLVLGHVHKHRHFNIVVSGRAEVSMNGAEPQLIQAGDVFESGAGVQKWLNIMEDMRWITVHANPDDCRDVPTLEERIVDASLYAADKPGNLTLDQFRLMLGNNHVEQKARVSLRP